MNDTEYQQISEDTINALQDVLEDADQRGDIEVEYQGGILTVFLPGGKQLLVSKHGVTRQLWLSSPVSGGLHFAYKDGKWQLPDGRVLQIVLQQELKQLAGLDITFR